MPERIQRRRTMGWRKPDGVVYVGRGSKFGNPFKIGDPHPVTKEPMDATAAVEVFRHLLSYPSLYDAQPVIDSIRAELAGKDLMCWCRLDRPCHADVLLEIANG
jgi:hypothetical protein